MTGAAVALAGVALVLSFFAAGGIEARRRARVRWVASPNDQDALIKYSVHCGGARIATVLTTMAWLALAGTLLALILSGTE